MRGRMIVTVLAIASGLFAAAPAAAAAGSPAPGTASAPRWRVLPSPLPGSDGRDWQDGEYDAVSCPATGFCLMLGSSIFQAPELMDGRWNGSEWFIDVAGLTGFPSGISCVSAKKCYAIVNDTFGSSFTTEFAGYAVWNGDPGHEFFGNWNGAFDLPREKKQGDWLNGISCPSSRFCMMVGRVGRNTLYALAFNGRKWRKVPVPKSRARQLNGVACPAANACFAVGPSPGGGQLGLIERWNGRHWRAQRAPVAAQARNISLNGVSCSTRTACVAVGGYRDRAKHGHVLALGWDGRAWRRLTFGGNTSGDLVSVSCVASGSCVAVGSLSRRPVARVWNGTRWSLQRLPAPGFASLSSVSCATASYCMAVGNISDGTAPVTISYF